MEPSGLKVLQVPRTPMQATNRGAAEREILEQLDPEPGSQPLLLQAWEDFGHIKQLLGTECWSKKYMDLSQRFGKKVTKQLRRHEEPKG